MKQRLIVMNGYRLVQSEYADQWQTDKVDKANGLRPSIYNLYLAMPADKSNVYEGIVLYTDKQFVYQQVEHKLVCHERSAFLKRPTHGIGALISYKNEQAMVTTASVQRDAALSVKI